MASKIEIINMALGWLGAPPIASMSENRPEARYASQYYFSALETTLRGHQWNFAQKREALAGITVPAGYGGRFAYAYAMPTGCIQAHKVLDAGENEYPFVVALGTDNGSKVLLTNVPLAILAYTALVEIPELYDPTFVRVLARRLAADLASPILKGNAQKVQECEALYDRALARAKLEDYQEGEKEEEEPVSWIKARTGGRG